MQPVAFNKIDQISFQAEIVVSGSDAMDCPQSRRLVVAPLYAFRSAKGVLINACRSDGVERRVESEYSASAGGSAGPRHARATVRPGMHNAA